MSRIGKKPISVPKGVKVDLKGVNVKVTGPKGALERNVRPEIEMAQNDGIIEIKCRDNSKRTDAFSGLTRTLINNMVIGVSEGFKRKLIIEGVGYRASVAGNVLTLNVGYSNPVEFSLPAGVGATVEKSDILLDCIDKELLGLTAARIRQVRKPEPYKGKGIRYEDEKIVRKVGKSGGK
ncbi:MAG: 50S ribosomal protein L6 [Proteobacteria bacterium]|nr:50S ribosomal protein L6 [Pseudomonadota bacterium]MBU1686031.1 50S ribosomal protein L6 [Pseudomonadota bacterium]